MSYNFLVPLVMFGWMPFTIYLFRKYTPQKAILISVIGGVLFLPVASYDLPMADYYKVTGIGASLFLGILFSGRITDVAFKPKLVDIPIITWCVISQFLSIMNNGLGLYNSVSSVVRSILEWGVCYTLGRVYFNDKESLRLLSKGIIIGGLIYVPLVFFEVRFSPQLSNIVYGFFPHSFLQFVRYGGYRPLVFMSHALMVSMWLAASFTISLWLYRTREITKIGTIPMVPVIILLFISVILAKCANAWVYSILAILGFYFFKMKKVKLFFIILIMTVPIYITSRITGTLSPDTIQYYSSKIFDAERTESLIYRVAEEDAFGKNALARPFLGWGWMDRAWPIDPITQEPLLPIDAWYLIVLCTNGLLGLISIYLVILSGPWKVMKLKTASTDAVVLSFILILFAIDSLLNAMINSVYLLIIGALIGFSENKQYREPAGSKVKNQELRMLSE